MLVLLNTMYAKKLRKWQSKCPCEFAQRRLCVARREVSGFSKKFGVQNCGTSRAAAQIVREQHHPYIQHMARAYSADDNRHPVTRIAIQPRLRTIRLFANFNWQHRR